MFVLIHFAKKEKKILNQIEPWAGGRGKKRKNKVPAKKKITAKDKIHQIVLKSSMANNSHQKDAIDRACCMKEELMERIERLGDKLPPNTLDQLIDELGGPENVAEVSTNVNCFVNFH